MSDTRHVLAGIPKQSDQKAAEEKSPMITTKWGSMDLHSVTAITKECDEVVMYGFFSCKYYVIKDILRQALSDGMKIGALKQVDDYELTETYEKTNIARINFQDTKDARACKALITNIVLENVLRLQANKKIIPVIFCIDIDNNQYQFNVENMLSKIDTYNDLITHKELRRACKLCTDPNLDIQKAAQATFKFVKVKVLAEKSYRLEEISAPYKDADYQKHMKTRKSQSHCAPKDNGWRPQLLHQISLLGKKETAAAPAPLKTIVMPNEPPKLI